ncbi:MAG: aspartate/glutamate racemase family protein [Eubacteriales bacterium]|nr:aspartate/glutamate racemase family protein [Eubacteriales bacterium]
MKLLYLIPGSAGPGFDMDEVKRREGILQGMASPGTLVTADVSGEGPLSIESAVDEANSVPSMIKKAVIAESEGYDGIIVGCAGDPGLECLKEAVRIPVVGPAQVSYAYASLIGRRFSVITPVDSCIGTTIDLIRKYGFNDNCVSIRSAGISVLDITKDPKIAEKKTREQSIIARDTDGADCIALGCMSLAFAGFDEELSGELGIPVINPLKTALYTLEDMVKMKLSQSMKAYPHRG